MKKLPKKLIWTLGVIFGLVLVTAIGLRLFFPAEKVKDMAVNLASEKLGRAVSVGEVGLSFSGGLGVELEGVQIANPPGFAGEPLFFAGKIDLKLQLGPLVRGEIQVNRLVVDQPRVRLLRRSDGTDNFTFDLPVDAPVAAENAGPGTDEEVADLAVSFERLEIRGGRLAFLDEEAGQGVAMSGLGLTGSLANPEPGVFHSSGEIAVDSLQVTGEQPVPVLAVGAAYDLTYDTSLQSLELKRGDLEVGGLPLSLTATMSTVPDSLRAVGEVRAKGITLASLLEFLTPEQRVALETITLDGTVSLESSFDYDQARVEPVAYEGSLMVADLRASTSDVEGELIVREIRCDFRPDGMKLASGGGSFAGQPLELELTVVDFDNPRVEGKVSGEMDLAFVVPFLPEENQASLAGLCRLEGSFAGGTENIEDMDYTGRAVFKDVFYADPALPDTLHQLNGSVSFDPASVTLEKLDARFGAGDLSVTGKMVNHLPYFLPAEKENRDNLTQPSLTFTAVSSRIDIDQLFPAAAPGATPATGTDAPGFRDTLAVEPVPDILAQGTFRADTLIYSKVPFTRVAGSIRFADRILECYDVTAGVYGGAAGGKVSMDLNDLNDPAYSGEFEATDIEADNFVTRFAGFGGVVFGKAGMSGSFSARGREPDRIKETLTLDSLAGITSGKVVTGQFVDSALGSLASKAGQKLDKEQTLKDLTTLIKVEDGRVGLDQFKTRLGTFGDLSLGGSYGFTGDLDYKGTILLSKDQTARLYASGGLAGSVASMFGNNAERLNLPISVGGSVTSPRMDIDYTELTDNIKSQLQNELTDDLKDEVGKKLKGLFGK